VLEYNRESEERVHKGFALAQAQLAEFFSKNTKKSTRCLHKILDITLTKTDFPRFERKFPSGGHLMGTIR
jgi:hypothetical protein